MSRVIVKKMELKDISGFKWTKSVFYTFFHQFINSLCIVHFPLSNSPGHWATYSTIMPEISYIYVR